MKAIRIKIIENTNSKGISEVVDDVVDDTVSKIGCGISDRSWLIGNSCYVTHNRRPNPIVDSTSLFCFSPLIHYLRLRFDIFQFFGLIGLAHGCLIQW